jgi:hypothetical protein
MKIEHGQTGCNRTDVMIIEERNLGGEGEKNGGDARSRRSIMPATYFLFFFAAFLAGAFLGATFFAGAFFLATFFATTSGPPLNGIRKKNGG